MLCCSCYEEKLEHETSQKKNQEKEKETKPKKKDVKFAAKNFQPLHSIANHLQPS